MMALLRGRPDGFEVRPELRSPSCLLLAAIHARESQFPCLQNRVESLAWQNVSSGDDACKVPAQQVVT